MQKPPLQSNSHSNSDIIYIINSIKNISGSFTLLLKIIVVLVFTINIMCLFQVINPYILFLDVDRILQNYQYWRLFTFTFAIWDWYHFFINLVFLILLSTFLHKLERHYSTLYVITSMIVFSVVLASFIIFDCLIIKIQGYRTIIVGGFVPLWLYLFMTYSKIKQQQQVKFFFVPFTITKIWLGYIVCLILIFLQWEAQSVFNIFLYYLTIKRLKHFIKKQPRSFHQFLESLIPESIKQRSDYISILDSFVKSINKQPETQTSIIQQLQ